MNLNLTNFVHRIYQIVVIYIDCSPVREDDEFVSTELP